MANSLNSIFKEISFEPSITEKKKRFIKFYLGHMEGILKETLLQQSPNYKSLWLKGHSKKKKKSLGK